MAFTSRRRLRIALAVFAALVAVCIVAGMSCFGRVVGGAEEGHDWSVHKGKCTVAIAYRDNVPDDQQRVTKLYTVPWIAAGYDDARYFVDEGFMPMRGRVRGALERARAEGCDVDLYWLVNGGDYVAWVEAIAPEQRPSLRFVYDTGAGGAHFADRWRALGARAHVGHPSVNVAPAFYTLFLPQWIMGATLSDAVASANGGTLRVLKMAQGLDLADESDVAELWSGTEAQLIGDGSLR